MSSRSADRPDAPAFGEAVAQWRLQLRTEVKKASALPTAMFDACDPMVEARLADTAESMLACLQEPAPQITEQASGEQRLEQVSAAELRALPVRLGAQAPAGLSLDEGLHAEYFGVLIDAWAQPAAAARDAAARRLAEDFTRGTADTLDADAAALWECTQLALAGAPGADSCLAETCKRIAAQAITSRLTDQDAPS